MPGRLVFDLSFGPPPRRREEAEPMRLLVLGDFSGKPAAERPPIADRPIPRVDVDNLEAVMRRLEPRVAGPAGEIRFERVDDFHPDRLYARLDLFEALRTARAAPPAGSDEDVARLLGKQAPVPARPSDSRSTGLDALIRDIVAPYVVKDTSGQVAGHLAAVDAAITGEMRKLLHDPAFQSIEAAWRGVHWIVSSVELDEHLQLSLLDVTREELVADVVAAQGRLSDTGIYRSVVDRARRAPGGTGWSALFGLFQFGPSDVDIGLLAALGLLASHAGGPFLAGADPALVRDDGGSQAGWVALRHSEASRWIGLAAPRVLLRLPYGRASDPVESFGFEEFGGTPVHEEFLWGSPSLAMAVLIGRSFTARGWECEPGDEREIGDLPAFTSMHEGERALQSCAERYLSEGEIHAFIRSGLSPLASRRDRNAIIAVRIQSVADPSAPLAW
jgi:type VI secretion system protein ImpC